VMVSRQCVELTGQLVLRPPKSHAGFRTVGIPPSIIPELRDHLADFAGPEATDLVFTGPLGGILRRGNFRRHSGWAARRQQAGRHRPALP
jgi:hypothetical protein